MNKWKIEYIDSYSNGRVKSTTYEGPMSEEQIIYFFGLTEPEVVWYRLTQI